MTPNEMFLQLLENNSFNSCDGERIADELRENIGLWDAVIFTRHDVGITLRDMAHNKVDYNADTLYIRTTSERVGPLMEYVTHWRADSTVVMMKEKSLSFTRDEMDELVSSICAHKESLESFLGSYTKEDTKRAVFELWWD